jgi:hypothetical protein
MTAAEPDSAGMKATKVNQHAYILLRYIERSITQHWSRLSIHLNASCRPHFARWKKVAIQANNRFVRTELGSPRFYLASRILPARVCAQLSHHSNITVLFIILSNLSALGTRVVMGKVTAD